MLVANLNENSEAIEATGLKLAKLTEDITAFATQQEAQLLAFEAKAQAIDSE